jgi:RimJ/RimL family protein N-acetyltransferase
MEHEIAAAAPSLAASYNDPNSRRMMLIAREMTAAEVVARYARVAAEGARSFLLLLNGALVGDAEFRRIEAGNAEFALQIDPSAQGKGFGTKLGIALHVVAFQHLAIERVYATILPENAASLRLFEKLGYRPDNSPAARAYVDEGSDESVSLSRADFERLHLSTLEDVRIVKRPRVDIP